MDIFFPSVVFSKIKTDVFFHVVYPQDWTLELEEAFSLEREGEFDKFASYREKLQNRMLLWHGK